MNIPSSLIKEAIGWRHHLHQNPELGFEEHNTSNLVVDVLTSLGIEVYTGLAKTGVVGILKKEKVFVVSAFVLIWTPYRFKK